jgi:hypothetical protein
MVLTNFSKLYDSDFFVDEGEAGEEHLLEGAPPDIVELYESYMEIVMEEIRTGRHIF